MGWANNWDVNADKETKDCRDYEPLICLGLT
jgi:hypothetical protein